MHSSFRLFLLSLSVATAFAVSPTPAQEGEQEVLIIPRTTPWVALRESGELNTALACELMKTPGSTGPFNPEGVPGDVLGWNFTDHWPAACEQVGVFPGFPGLDGGFGGSGGDDQGDPGGPDGGTGSSGETPPPPRIRSGAWIIDHCKQVMNPVNVSPEAGVFRQCVLDARDRACERAPSCYPEVGGGYDIDAPDDACLDDVVSENGQALEQCMDEFFNVQLGVSP